MITTLNGITADIQAKYLKLFTEASAALEEANLLEPTYSPAPNFNPDSFLIGTYYIKNGEEYVLANTYEETIGQELYIKTSSITTLEEYFCNIKNLYDLQINDKFLMLPLDEDFFEINANTRTITVPNSFKKGVGVVGDVIAETLLFRVDRFFDTMDLYTTDIYVQWEGSDKKQYVSLINMKDVETYADEGKIVFGWPLTDKLAATAGTIKFAVRFIKTDPAVEDKIVYSLGTLSATATINASLAFDIFSAIQDDGANDLFADAIENSESTVGPQAKAPVFVNDLPAIAYMSVDSDGYATYSIYATTSVADLGNVTYKWYHKADADSRRVFLASDAGNDDTSVAGGNFRVYTLFKKTEDKVLDANKVYYVTEDGLAYTRNDDLEADVANLYERYSVLEISGYEADIPEDGSSPVTGYYYVEATNRTNGREKTSKSTSVELPVPAVPALQSDLPSAKTLEDGKANLVYDVSVEKNASKDYDWMYSMDKEEWEALEGDDGTYVASVVGYYKASASATMNLARASIESNVCKVVDLPVAPGFADGFKADEEVDVVYLAKNTEIVPVLESIPSGELYSDMISYRWEADAGDDNQSDVWADITSESTTPELALTRDLISAKVRCIATNTLNGNTASAISRIFLIAE